MSGRTGAAVAAITLTLTALSASQALAATPPTVAVGPHQLFQGAVNGQASDATIDMACAGPVYPGETGHPAAGQTTGVTLITDPSGTTAVYGYTGDTASSIVAGLSPVSSVSKPVAVFSGYGTQALSTSVTLPCSGTGTLEFTPSPDSGGRAYALTVRFVSLP